MPTFQTRDSTTPDFWTERFEQQFMPWDRGGVPQAFKQFVAAAPRPMTTLIPGCGMGYEVAYLCEAGWDVTAIDFSPVAVAVAKQVLGARAQHVIEANFFDFQPTRSLDVIYERAFLCALPSKMWAQVAARWAALLPAGGVLAGYFYLDNASKGPPFGITEEALSALLTPYFKRINDDPVADSIPVFEGRERWQIWQRCGDNSSFGTDFSHL